MYDEARLDYLSREKRPGIIAFYGPFWLVVLGAGIAGAILGALPFLFL